MMIDFADRLTADKRPGKRVDAELFRTYIPADPGRDGFFADGDSARPPVWLVEYARSLPEGWVAECEDPRMVGTEPPAYSIRGDWRVFTNGEPTGFFRPNADYRPLGLVEPGAKPLGYSRSVLRFFPAAARRDVAYIVQKFGSPRLVAAVMFGRDFTEAVYDELVLACVQVACGPWDEDWNPLPETIWFDSIVRHLTHCIRPKITDPAPDGGAETHLSAFQQSIPDQ